MWGSTEMKSELSMLRMYASHIVILSAPTDTLGKDVYNTTEALSVINAVVKCHFAGWAEMANVAVAVQIVCVHLS